MTLDLRLGTWQDVLVGTYDPARAVVITDPPYGLDMDKGYDDLIPWRDHVRDVLAMLPAVRHVIRGPATAIIQRDYPQPKRLAVETALYRRRAMFHPGVVPHMWQAWCVYGRTSVGREGRPRPPIGDALTIRPYGSNQSSGSGGHRGVTPYASAMWALGDWAEFGEGWMVLDPFAGIGTIGRAASTWGLDYIGAEREPRWHAESLVLTQYAQPEMVFA